MNEFCIYGIDFRTFPPDPSYGQRVLATPPPELENQQNNFSQDNKPKSTIADICHPEYFRYHYLWELWRVAYIGGMPFTDYAIKAYSNREDQGDIIKRKMIIPIPAFAKAGINDIRNSLTQRLTNVKRQAGPTSYQKAVQGLQGGVDRQGSSMLAFLYKHIIPELLSMGKVGIYVDAPPIPVNATAAFTAPPPFIYIYTRENIRNWTYDQYGTLQSLLLRDYVDVVEPQTRLPIGIQPRYRFLWKTVDNQVNCAFFNQDGLIEQTYTLAISYIPFHAPQLTASLMEDIANHQVALLNLEASDIMFCLKTNHATYTEQRDRRFESSHLKKANLPLEVRSAVAGSLESNFIGHDNDATEIKIGDGHGRYYDVNTERPEYIAPPEGPLKMSMEKQTQLKEDIRLLLSLSLSGVRGIASADAKLLDQQGTEAGLAAIGKELQFAEQVIANMWAGYTSSTPAEVTYPESYSLKTDQDKFNLAESYAKHLDTVPSQTYRRAIQLEIATSLLNNADLITIKSEINAAQVPTADSQELISDLEAGLVGKELISKARGYPDGQVAIASKEHTDRLAAIAQSQSPVTSTIKNAAARGVKDLAPTPNADAQQEKQEVDNGTN